MDFRPGMINIGGKIVLEPAVFNGTGKKILKRALRLFDHEVRYQAKTGYEWNPNTPRFWHLSNPAGEIYEAVATDISNGHEGKIARFVCHPILALEMWLDGTILSDEDIKRGSLTDEGFVIDNIPTGHITNPTITLVIMSGEEFDALGLIEEAWGGTQDISRNWIQ